MSPHTLLHTAERAAREGGCLEASTGVVRPRDSHEPGVDFSTSGSTGSPLVLRKSWRALFAEAHTLASTFEVDSNADIAVLVPPHHIYGFLLGIMLPMVTRARVRFSTPRQSFPFAEAEDLAKASHVVLVPSLWPRIQSLITQIPQAPLTVFSSGAPFGETRAADFLSRGWTHVRLHEILGSTETGGIGHREIRTLPLPPYRLFPNVTLRPGDDGFSILTPYTDPPHVEMKVADSFELLEEGRFLHLGRSDRIFKYAGVRHSLTALETALSEILGGAWVRCFFHPSPTHSKGGVLEAFVVRPSLSAEVLRGAFLQRHALPFPEVFRVLTEQPVNSLGKTTYEALCNTAGPAPEGTVQARPLP